jgi:hypothetical protein
MMWGPRVGEFQLENMKAICNVYNNLEDEKNLGVMFTHWEPYRYTQNAQWDTYALASEMVNNTDEYDMMATLKKFTESRYGLVWNNDWEKIYSDMYKYTPKNNLHGGPLGGIGFFPWRNQEDLKFIFSKKIPFENSFIETVRLLEIQCANVNTNINDFEEFFLSAEYLAHIVWRENYLASLKEDASSMSEVLAEIAEKDKKLLAKIKTVWERGRKGKMNEKYIWKFPLATAYSAKLVEDDTELKEVLKDVIK